MSFGQQKINLHQVGREICCKGSCTVVWKYGHLFYHRLPLKEAQAHIEPQNVEIIERPMARIGAVGKLLSIYIRHQKEE